MIMWVHYVAVLLYEWIGVMMFGKVGMSEK